MNKGEGVGIRLSQSIGLRLVTTLLGALYYTGPHLLWPHTITRSFSQLIKKWGGAEKR